MINTDKLLCRTDCKYPNTHIVNNIHRTLGELELVTDSLVVAVPTTFLLNADGIYYYDLQFDDKILKVVHFFWSRFGITKSFTVLESNKDDIKKATVLFDSTIKRKAVKVKIGDYYGYELDKHFQVNNTSTYILTINDALVVSKLTFIYNKYGTRTYIEYTHLDKPFVLDIDDFFEIDKIYIKTDN